MTLTSLFIWFTFILLLSTNINALRQHSLRQKRADACENPNNNACTFIQCQNGAPCREDPTITACFRCECTPGFTGQLCETSTAVTPAGCNLACQNSGFCNINYCVCPAGYTGTLCEKIDHCFPTNPCANGGRCISTDASFVCDCTGTGHDGQLCTNPVVTNPCSSAPCQNGGQCSWDGTTMHCSCVNGYMGRLCEIYTDPCTPSVCQNGGVCETVAANSFRCRCTAQYTGIRCEKSISANHVCALNPQSVCFNGATCTLNDADYVCNCPAGWTGRNCQTPATVTTCNPNPCGAHGTCQEGITPTGTIAACNCDSGWTGKFCDTNMNECPVGFCLSGGVCRMNGNSAYCDCPATYTGFRCETYIGAPTTTTTTAPGTILCSTNPCQNGGTCYVINGIDTCTCLPNWAGRRCETFTSSITTTTTPWTGVSPCVSSPCQNGGTCSSFQSTFGCTCAPNWTGPTCTIYMSAVTTTTTAGPVLTQCTANPCLNNGFCYIQGNGFYCSCQTGWKGSLCETSSVTTPATGDACLSQPCRNGGTCYNVNNSFTCQCTAGFTGDICQATKPASCPLNCAPGECILSGSVSSPYACLCNGVMKLKSCV